MSFSLNTRWAHVLFLGKKSKMQRENVLRAVFRKSKSKMQRENVSRAVFRKSKSKMQREMYHMPFQKEFKRLGQKQRAGPPQLLFIVVKRGSLTPYVPVFNSRLF